MNFINWLSEISPEIYKSLWSSAEALAIGGSSPTSSDSLDEEIWSSEYSVCYGVPWPREVLNIELITPHLRYSNHHGMRQLLPTWRVVPCQSIIWQKFNKPYSWKKPVYSEHRGMSSFFHWFTRFIQAMYNKKRWRELCYMPTIMRGIF